MNRADSGKFEPRPATPKFVFDQEPYRRPNLGIAGVLWFATVCAASYAIGISLFYVIDGVSNYATHFAAGNPFHDAIAFVLMAIATCTLLAPLFQASAGRTIRTFGVLTAIALTGFAVLHDQPGYHVDAPLIYLNERVLEPFVRLIKI